MTSFPHSAGLGMSADAVAPPPSHPPASILTRTAPSGQGGRATNGVSQRRDIDGLRAIAVTAVLLFHGFPKLAPGGFVGVDIFFVISGFLISGGILRDLRHGSFTYRNFYSRRIRRIFPALSVVLVCCLILGYVICLPGEFKALAKHVVAGSAFASNLALLRESGYFAVASDSKPLLHLWSLGIEEQFYIVWPIALAAAFSARRRGFSLILLSALGSFLASWYLVATIPTATWYFPLTRFWELIIGAMLAWAAMREYPVLVSIGRAKGLVSVIGLACVGVAIIFLSRRTPFPGPAALLPTIGTALVIAAGDRCTLNRVVLGNPVMVYIGAISYPLYLWHWPLLTFGRLTGVTGSVAVAGILLIATGLAAITYRVIEIPVRFGRYKYKSPAYIAGALAAVAIVGIGIYVTGGRYSRLAHAVPVRWLDAVAVPASETYAPCAGAAAAARGFKPRIDWCLQSSQTPPTAALFGDSHAWQLFAGFARVDHSRGWLLMAQNSCPPLNGVELDGFVRDCRARTEEMTRVLSEDANIRTVVLAFFGNFFMEPYAADHVGNHVGAVRNDLRDPSNPTASREEIAFHGLDRTVELLEDSGKHVVLVIDVPELPFFPVDKIRLLGSSIPALTTGASLPREAVMARQANLRSIVARLQTRHPALLVYDALDALCDAARCYSIRDGAVLYQDSHHLSLPGSVRFVGDFLHTIPIQDRKSASGW